MGKYYRSKKAGKGRGWMRRNMGRAGSALKKRYYSGGKLSLAKVASDAKYALSIAKTARGLLNTEKKRHEFNYYNQILGQVDGTSGSGHYILDISPTVSQGTGFGNRVGASISLRSTCLNIQLQQQTSSSSPVTVTFYVIQVKDAHGLQIGEFFNYNRYLFALNSVAIYDSHCQRDPDYFNLYKVIRRKRVRLAPDQVSGQTMIKDVQIKMNYGRNGHHIRFNDNTASQTNIQYYLLAVCDSGNRNGTNASTLTGVPQTAVSTGVWMQLDGVNYFIDN